MASQRSSQNGQRMPDPIAMRAARKYVWHYQTHAIQYLYDNCDPAKLLYLACEAEGHNYHSIMLQDSDTEGDTKSQSSRRRTLSSDSRSGLTSSSSAILSSSSSANGSSEIIYVVPETGPTDTKTLMATRLSQSDYLIRTDVARDRLNVKRPSANKVVQYKGGPIRSCGTISLHWAWNSDDLNSENVQRSTFYMVGDLPDTKAVLRDSDAQDSPVDHAGAEKRPPFIRHGTHLVQPQYTNPLTENSTTPTVRPVASRAGQVPRERQQSTASEKSKIPKPKTSASSVRSVSSAQPRIPGGRLSQGTPTPPPPSSPFSQADPPKDVRVSLLWDKSHMGATMLDLRAEGSSLYETLNTIVSKKTRRNLDPDSDSVRFAQRKDDRDTCCWVSLRESMVAGDWIEAVEWLDDLEKGSRIYAVIERTGG